jgi:hypothetical protein
MYEGSDYSDARGALFWGGLDNSWSESDQFGKGWAAKWQGSIVAPVSGPVRFIASTDQELKVSIDGREIIDSKRSILEETVQMVLGCHYPIIVSFAKSGSEYDCYMKVQWSWDGQPPTTIDRKALVHSDKIKAKVSKEVELAKKAKMRTYENGPEDALLEDIGKPYLPRWSSLRKHNAAPDWFCDAGLAVMSPASPPDKVAIVYRI